MTRSNMHIKLTNGHIVQCVADSSSAPEQGWIVETLLIPLLAMNDAEKELALITEWCTLNEQRVNAVYRYIISLPSKTVHFFEENYSYSEDRFYLGDNITHRYYAYIASHNALGELLNDINENPL
ncbi:penicillin-binding protein [Mucilaginibacter rubeus]|uniref:Penicillin-binding protein n=1 Tax=Mucilaginibacter rubeus TaxID=2027860 RepID=A0AAE6JKT7_9SPHI|nr:MULTISPECIES: penicillin-binding protein [Mucilaginibacter]QEM07884.1 penicillin-binding protein [Mucilaginibacter rubeus]QEM20336.1 penicillin-binding protein [Mucilaginibacter gossypii]QTE42945.1 penicillin-binding protein [Mucilaginibacter rubeus]QTE49546.1 penicillin-binding protein [Mucilaginibacter rubeus]QTE54642.1 penicillin-binding protein [Mucilaginibacter rubeus]